MACRAWHGIWYGLARYCMVYDIAGGHDMVYGMAWRVMAWYIVWPGKQGMVYDKVWRGMAWYVQMPWAMVPFTCGEADVIWRSCSHVQDPFTSKVTVTCIFRSHVQLLFTLGSDNTLRDCEYISLFWDRIFEKAYTCNIY